MEITKNKAKELIDALGNYERKILTITAKNFKKDIETGVEINDGYNYQINSSLPEIADSIAKFAVELETNEGLQEELNIDKGAGSMFLNMIGDFFVEGLLEVEKNEKV